MVYRETRRDSPTVVVYPEARMDSLEGVVYRGTRRDSPTVVVYREARLRDSPEVVVHRETKKGQSYGGS